MSSKSPVRDNPSCGQKLNAEEIIKHLLSNKNITQSQSFTNFDILYDMTSPCVTDDSLVALLLSSDSLFATKFKVWSILALKQHCNNKETSLISNINNLINDDTVKFYNSTVHRKYLNKSGVYFSVYESGEIIKFQIKSTSCLQECEDIKILDFFEVFYFKEFEEYIKNSNTLTRHAKQTLHKTPDNTTGTTGTTDTVYNCNIIEYVKIVEFVKKNQEHYKSEKEELNEQQISIRDIKASAGCKIQKYKHADNTGELLKTYKNISEVVRSEEGTNEKAIKKAIRDSTEYKGFRWMNLDRTLPDDTKQELGETVVVKHNNTDYVAMLNLEKDTIVNVFKDQKDASQSRKLKSISAINNALKNGTICSGHYFNYFKNCPSEIQEKYLTTNKLPEKSARSNSHSVCQINPITSETVATYDSLVEAQKKCQVSRNVLVSACKTGEILKGFIWTYVS
jgi:hypothetical protein